MPRIDDAYTHCAVYIYASMADARNGEQYGGSGFLAHVSLTENPDWQDSYVVTNWHVVKEAKTPVIRLNRRDDTVEYIESSMEHWFRHQDGDDIAVLPVDLGFSDLQVWSIDLELFVTSKIVFDEDIGIGDDTVMIGRFVNHEGKQKNSPAVRFGNIAMMAEEKIITEDGLAQEAFLVEVRSLPGYSGSAVFIYSPCAINDMSQRRDGRRKGEHPPGKNPSKWTENEGRTTVTVADFGDLTWTRPKGPFLLGIDFCHIRRKANVLTPDGKKVEDKLYVEENTGMAGVIPAWKIAEVLNLEELRAMRDKEDHEITERKNKSRASLDTAIAEEPQKTQTTARGMEIPIPATDQFFGDLEKASRKKD
jgi:hypothetical protein